MQIKKKELNELCFNLLNQSLNEETKQVIFNGLTTEQMSLGLKRRLEKIRIDALKHLEEYQSDIAALTESIKVKAAAKLPDGAKREEYENAEKDSTNSKLWNELLDGFKAEALKELEDLGNEEVKIDRDPASLVMIEKIETKAVYNWELIEKIAV